MTVHGFAAHSERRRLLGSLRAARRHVESVRRELGVDINSMWAIENELNTGRIDVERAYALIERTWPPTAALTGYSFGSEVSRQASDDAYRKAAARRGRVRW